MLRKRSQKPQNSTFTSSGLSMLNVNVHDSPLQKYWTTVACLKGISGEIFLLLKRIWQFGSGLQNSIWSNKKTSGTMTFEQMRQSRNAWPKHRTAKTALLQKHPYHLLRTGVEGWWFRLVLQPLGILCSTTNSFVYQHFVEY